MTPREPRQRVAIRGRHAAAFVLREDRRERADRLVVEPRIDDAQSAARCSYAPRMTRATSASGRRRWPKKFVHILNVGRGILRHTSCASAWRCVTEARKRK
jgi:hypothetical protein